MALSSPLVFFLIIRVSANLDAVCRRANGFPNFARVVSKGDYMARNAEIIRTADIDSQACLGKGFSRLSA